MGVPGPGRILEYLREASGGRLDRILAALREAAGRRDPHPLYHRMSELDEDYYGGEPVLPEDYEEYYKSYPEAPRIPLPPPMQVAGADVLATIRSRRSRRSYAPAPLTIGEISTLLFYTVGVVGEAWWKGPKRVYPSAGALQPVEAYLVAGLVEGVPPGVYHYNPGSHELELLAGGDQRGRLGRACLDQEHVAEAPASIILTMYYPRTASKYGFRAYRYALLDTGFAGENLYLAAEALGLATVAVGAFYDRALCSLLGVDCYWELPQLVFPVGRRVG